MSAHSAKSRRWYLRPLPIVTMAGTLTFCAWFAFGPGGLWDNYQLQKQKRDQAAQIRLLEDRRQMLQKYLDDLRAGDELAMERAAREHGLVGPGETIYNIQVEPNHK
jgi:cell division protein FtsB